MTPDVQKIEDCRSIIDGSPETAKYLAKYDLAELEFDLGPQIPEDFGVDPVHLFLS